MRSLALGVIIGALLIAGCAALVSAVKQAERVRQAAAYQVLCTGNSSSEIEEACTTLKDLITEVPKE